MDYAHTKLESRSESVYYFIRGADAQLLILKFRLHKIMDTLGTRAFKLMFRYNMSIVTFNGQNL